MLHNRPIFIAVTFILTAIYIYYISTQLQNTAIFFPKYDKKHRHLAELTEIIETSDKTKGNRTELQTNQPSKNQKSENQSIYTKYDLPPILFIKTHKTGSSTVQNILYRLALKHDLSVAFPAGSLANNFFWPNKFKTDYLQNDLRTVDIFCNHAVYSEDILKSFPRKRKVFKFTILREPSSLFKSTFNYFKTKVEGFRKAGSMEKFLEEPDRYFSREPAKSASLPNLWPLARNHLIMDLGYPAQITDEKAIDSAITEISERLDLVLIQEQFFESMIFLKHALNLELEDITYFIQNAVDTIKFSEGVNSNDVRSKSNDTASNTTSKMRAGISNSTIAAVRSWNAADYKLYDHFLNEFENHKTRFGIEKMADEVASLKTAISDLQKKCVARTTYDFDEIPDGLKPFRPDPKLKVMGFVPKGNLTFKDHDRCFNVMAPELKLAKKLRYKQHMTGPYNAKKAVVRHGRI